MNILHIQKKGFLLARGRILSDDSFEVLKGSAALDLGVSGNLNLRKKLEEEGVIADGVFEKNYKFPSSSAAAGQVLGRSSNGRLEWKEYQSKNLALQVSVIRSRGEGILAYGYQLPNGHFVVLERSMVKSLSEEIITRPQDTVRRIRQSLIDNGTIKDGIFVKRYVFNSISAAAMQVLGRSANGYNEWKTLSSIL